jgi:hypothetical protein
MAQIVSSSSASRTSSLISLLQTPESRYNPLSVSALNGFEAEVSQFVQKYLTVSNSALSAEAKKDVERLVEISSRTLQECKARQLSLEWLSQRIERGHANLICSELPSAFYNGVNFRLERPEMGHYGETYQVSLDVATLRLHPVQMANFPESVRNAAGDVRDKKIEFFLSAETTGGLRQHVKEKKLPHVFNLILHGWAHPCYEKGKDSTEMVDIGVYEPEGVYPIQTPAGISFHHQKELPVICHPKDGRTALSPNNAHIGINENALFSSFWLVAKLKDRVLIAKQVLFNEWLIVNRMNLIWGAFNNASTVNEAFQNLRMSCPVIMKSLLDAAESYESGSPEADKIFDQLFDSFKNSAYQETWQQTWKNKELPPPHADFGCAAFHGHTSLDPQYRCNSRQKGAILRAVASKFEADYERLVDGIESVFAPPKFILPLSEEQRKKEQLLNPIVEAFKNGESEKGLQLFGQLDPSYKQNIYNCVWRHFGCPRNFAGDFGAASFYASPELKVERQCDNAKRAKMILYYLHSL